MSPSLVPGWTCGKCGQHVRPAAGQVVPTLAQHAASCPARKVLDLPPLSTRQAALALNVTTKTVEKWVAQGRLVSIRLGRLRRIPAAVIADVLANGLPLRPPRPVIRAPRPTPRETTSPAPPPRPLGPVTVRVPVQAPVIQLPARPRRPTPSPPRGETA